MSRHEVPFPQWSPKEDIIAAWFLSRGLETPDVARIMAHRLRRPNRKIVAFIRRMEGLNLYLARRGYRKLCTEGMFDWNKGAVDDFLIGSTRDGDLLYDLLSFDSRHTWLLKTVSPIWHSHPLTRPLLIAPCPQYLDLDIPLQEVFRVGDMQQELNSFLQKHRDAWRIRYPRRSIRFY